MDKKYARVSFFTVFVIETIVFVVYWFCSAR